MSGNDKAEVRDGGDASQGDARPQSVPRKKQAGRPSDVGRALRSVYDDTLREDIPPDLQDLLGRLD